MKAIRIIGMALVLSIGSVPARASDATLRVVMQVNSQNIMVIVRALRDALEITDQAEHEGSKLDMKVVVYGSSLDQFESGGDAELKAAFLKLSKRADVRFYASEDTLRRIHKTLRNLLPGFSSVASGPVEVLKLEKAGYLYMKP